MQIRIKNIPLFILLFSIAGLNTNAQQQLDQKKLQQYLDIQKERLGFSGTIIVSCSGKSIFSASTGKSSVELNVPVSANTVFPVASITKSFTATLTLIAAAEGKLALTDSLFKFFPQLSDSGWRSITVDQLLSHRSGIPHNEGIPGYWTEKSSINYARVPAMKEIFSLQLEARPGSQVKYSSPGYFVLASILENLYGKSYGVLIHEKICIPLNLTYTGQLDNKTIVPDLASGYLQTADRLTAAPYRSYSLMKGSGDLYTSGTDLIKFLHSFENQKWPEILKKEMFIAHSINAVERGDLYSYGWFIREKQSGRPKAYYHGGGSFGVSALMARYPEEKLCIIILSNISVLPVNQIWSDIESIVLGKPFEMPAVRTSLSIVSKTIQSIAGTYAATNGMQLTLTANNGKLFAKMGNNPPFELFQESSLKFYGKKVPVDFIFELDNSGRATEITAKGMGQQFNFIRK